MDAEELAGKMAGFCCHELGEMDAEAAVFLLPYARALIEAEKALDFAAKHAHTHYNTTRDRAATALASLRSLLEKA